ncbi:MAG TPA: sugar transferase [Terriglobales bacterium]|jgi:lipopolysaccharide/colanic/teichoic acid biosynthesis glycosyltransferase|nr:sugar transferase [Terriglobales bacterium]
MIKRMFDVVASVAALSVFWPLLIFIGLIIRLDSPGPAIYRSRRAGRWGNSFSILKFRTMVVDAEKLGGPSTADDDPRVTRAGKILRKYKLDELPQLLNVLKGEMSIVGPRPEVLPEVELYSAEERQLLSVLPGITDWASLRFRNEGEILKGSADAHQAYWEKIRPEKIRLGLKYARSHSFLEDMRIVFETLAVVFRDASSDAIE